MRACAVLAGGEAVRTRTGGGVVQLSAAAGAARTAEYQETHVQVTLASDVSKAAGSGAGPAAAAASLSGFKRPSAAQPFFLRAAGAAAAAEVGACGLAVRQTSRGRRAGVRK
jgi:hypothetical protein